MKITLQEQSVWPELSDDNTQLPDEIKLVLATLMHQSETYSNHISEQKPEIINHHTKSGQTRLTELLRLCQSGKARFDSDQYEAAHEELVEISAWMQSVPEDTETVIQYMTETLHAFVPEIPVNHITSLLSVTSLAEDLVSLAKEARILGSDLQKIEADSRWIWLPEDKLLTKMIGKEAYYLLTVKSRALGLIPFQALDKLRNLKIRCAGASAVVHLLDLLASLGAENMKWWDAGATAPSNIGRLGRVGNLKRLGKGKATSLQNELLAAYPYASFEGSKGKVVADSTKEKSETDISYSEFVEDADLVIEVIDSAQGKIDLRLHIKEHSGNVKVVYLADVNDAFVRIEDTQSANHFGQSLPESHFVQFSKLFAELQNQQPQTEEVKKQAAFLNLQAVVHMLYKQFPPEHQLQFLYIIGGLTPFWAQTAISARESAAVGSRLILELLLDQPSAIDTTYTSETVSHSFNPEFTAEQLETLQKIMITVFQLPLDLDGAEKIIHT